MYMCLCMCMWRPEVNIVFFFAQSFFHIMFLIKMAINFICSEAGQKTNVEVKRQIVGVCSLPLPCEFHRANPGCQFSKQVLFPAEPSFWLLHCFESGLLTECGSHQSCQAGWPPSPGDPPILPLPPAFYVDIEDSNTHATLMQRSYFSWESYTLSPPRDCSIFVSISSFRNYNVGPDWLRITSFVQEDWLRRGFILNSSR